MSPTTPAGVTIQAHLPDGSTVEVTEGVQALYDLVIQSMDWGSGFISYEDAVPVAKIARVCGFEGVDEAERYLREEQHDQEQRAFWREHPEANQYWAPGDPRGQHEHVYSQAKGECLFRMCGAKLP